MTKPSLSNYPYVEAFNQGDKQRPTAMYIRLSNTPYEVGAALAIANTWHKRNSPVDSCHYVTDEVATYQCVPDKVTAFHKAYGSKGQISINVCAYPTEDVSSWDRTNVINQTAELAAEISIIHKIRVRYLNDAQLMRWNKRKWRHRGGIIVNVEGDWPYSSFLEKVNAFRDEFNRV